MPDPSSAKAIEFGNLTGTLENNKAVKARTHAHVAANGKVTVFLRDSDRREYLWDHGHFHHLIRTRHFHFPQDALIF
jgi:hypothetical protein